MQRKIGTLFLIQMLLLLAILPVSTLAGDPDDPEITDDLDDTYMPHLDIKSAWFFENPDEPQYLFTALEVKSINLKANAVLSIRWSYKGTEYVSALDTYLFKKDVFRSGDPKQASHWQWIHLPKCEGTINQETNVITWKILKSNIGNPGKDDILTNTRAAAVPSGWISFIYFLTGRDYRDFAPNEQGMYGLDYQIQYTA
jgi:hypothetical protein